MRQLDENSLHSDIQTLADIQLLDDFEIASQPAVIKERRSSGIAMPQIDHDILTSAIKARNSRFIYSDLQKQIAQLIFDGYKCVEIASQMDLNFTLIQIEAYRLMVKMGVHSQNELFEMIMSLNAISGDFEKHDYSEDLLRLSYREFLAYEEIVSPENIVLTRRGIAAKMGISDVSLRNYSQKINKKLGTGNRVELLRVKYNLPLI